MFDMIQGGVGGLGGATSVTVSPDGGQVYATFGDRVGVFNRNAATGLLVLLEVFIDGQGGFDALFGAASVAVSPDGENVYVAAFVDDAVTVFARDAATGLLSLLEVVEGPGLDGASSVAVSPDGLDVYVAGGLDDAVVVFARDDVTGTLTPTEVLFDGVGGVEGLNGAASVAVSPDGLDLYVAGFADSAVAVFARDDVTGTLTFTEALFDDAGGIDGLGGATAVTLSSEGADVYVAGFDDDAVVVFARDPMTGTLVFTEAVTDGVGRVDGLNGPTSLVVSPPDPAATTSTVYVGSCIDATVVTFRRDVATGALTFVETASTSDLTGVQFVDVSSDAMNLYVADLSGLAVIQLPEPSPALAGVVALATLLGLTGIRRKLQP